MRGRPEGDMATMGQHGSGTTPPSERATACDPPPTPPPKPLPFDCCESGCDRCVFDTYADELAHYQSALAAWRARHPRRDSDAGDS